MIHPKITELEKGCGKKIDNMYASKPCGEISKRGYKRYCFKCKSIMEGFREGLKEGEKQGELKQSEKVLGILEYIDELDRIGKADEIMPYIQEKAKEIRFHLLEAKKKELEGEEK